ncbi:hypothetical protein diail_4315 [Diaporthe ilicicola]|nr:hypothetical protein diail_4315 [Diaporthe ilicicola]
MSKLLIYHAQEWAVLNKIRDVLLRRTDGSYRQYLLQKAREISAPVRRRQEYYSLNGVNDGSITAVQLAIEIRLEDRSAMCHP